MSKSIKKNFVYNIINVLSTLLFPLVTFPYASRVVLVEGIGLVQFINSIINYVILFTSIGIPMYAIKEIARDRDDQIKMSKTCLEILILHLSLTVLGYIVIAVIALFVPKLSSDLVLYLILSASLFFTTIGCSWFYSGIEDFKYITIRGVIIKTISAILLFTLVHEKTDLYVYAAISVLGTVGNNLVNFIRLKKFVILDKSVLRDISPYRHFIPSLHVFALNVIVSIYINLDSVMLGFLSDVKNVGYYAASSRLSHIMVTLVTSLGSVILPRLSNLIKNNQIEDFNKLSQKSYYFLIMISIPLTCAVIILAPSLIRLFGGNDFLPAINTLRILMPITIIIGLSQLLGVQILYPKGKVNTVILCTGFGAIVNFILNIILIPMYQHNGAAFATLAAEIIVTISMYLIARDDAPKHLFDKNIISYLIASVLMTIGILSASKLVINDIQYVIFSFIIGIFIYSMTLYIFKDMFILEIVNKILKKDLYCHGHNSSN